MRSTKRYVLLALIILSLFMVSCTKQYIYTTDDLSTGISAKLNLSKEEAYAFIPFAPNDKVKEIARTVRFSGRQERGKIDLILNLILDENGLNVAYDSDANYNAYQVLVKKSANCISFTNLFVAIAREVGLDATFVDVTQVRKYHADDVFLYKEGHICAGIKLSGIVHLVDFVYNSKEYKKYKIISDYEAIANYLTLLGVDNDKKYLRTSDENYLNKAIYYHTAALSLDPKSTRAMNNLGVIYMRFNRFEAAEKLFRRAVAVDEDMNIARFNLAELVSRQGNLNEAIELLEENAEISIRDPFTHYRLGQIYFALARPEKAEFHLKKAINFEEKYINPRLVLISLYLSQERFDEAEEIIEDSEDLFPGNLKVLSFREILKKNPLEKRLVLSYE